MWMPYFKVKIGLLPPHLARASQRLQSGPRTTIGPSSEAEAWPVPSARPGPYKRLETGSPFTPSAPIRTNLVTVLGAGDTTGWKLESYLGQKSQQVMDHRACDQSRQFHLATSLVYSLSCFKFLFCCLFVLRQVLTI